VRALAVAWTLRRIARSAARMQAGGPGETRTVIETEYEIIEHEAPPDRRIDRE
jgi:hypothetical protein